MYLYAQIVDPPPFSGRRVFVLPGGIMSPRNLDEVPNAQAQRELTDVQRRKLIDEERRHEDVRRLMSAPPGR